MDVVILVNGEDNIYYIFTSFHSPSFKLTATKVRNSYIRFIRKINLPSLTYL